jgi:hypothetical protein
MKTLEAPVILHLPVNSNLTNSYLKEEEKLKDVAVSVKSDIMDSYENGSPFNGKDEIISLVQKKEGLVNFSIGTDGRLYLIKRDKKGKEYWENNDISAPLIDKLEAQNSDKKYEVITFNAIHSGPKDSEDNSIAVMCCIAEVGNRNNYEIWITPDVTFKQNESSKWKSLGKIDQIQLEFMRMTRDTANASSAENEFTLIACGRKESNGFVDSFIYKPTEEKWKYIQLGSDIEDIIDLQFGMSSVTGPGVYVLGTYQNRGRFIFAGFYQEDNELKIGTINNINPFKNPAAFITDKIDDPSNPNYGCSEVYMVDAIDAQTNQIKFWSAEAQSGGDAINIGNNFKGTAQRIFLTRNAAKRIDLYTHVIENSTGNLLHLFNANTQKRDENKWSPIYTLEKDISIIAPACNVEGRICELFIIGEKSENLRYLWQDDKLFSWNRDLIRVKATGQAIATKCVQTKITFTDAKTGKPIIFKQYKEQLNITIEASKSVNTQINNKKYTLNPKKPVTIDSKELIGDLILISNVTEVDSPYYSIKADFFAKGELVVHPIAKIQDDMKTVTNKKVQSPKDRYGNDLNVKLVEGEKATDQYLDGVLPGVNKLASYSLKTYANNMELISNSPDLDHMNREGVWFKEMTPQFDTRLDFASLPDGVLFAIDFNNASPAFLSAEECLRKGIKGLENYSGIWDDLVRFFGSFIEAVKNSVEKVLTFIVEKVSEGLVFTIKFMGEAIRCAVKFAEQVMETVNMVLIKYLGIDLSKIIQWLGAIFDIDYLRATQKEFASRMTKTIEKIREGSHSAQEKVDQFFNKIRTDFANGLFLFSDSGEPLKAALNKKDIAEVKKIFLSHHVKLTGEVEITCKEQGKKWLVDDSQYTYTVATDDNKLSVFVRITVPKEMKNMTMKSFQESTVKKAETQLGKTPEEIAANKKIIDQHQSSLKGDPVLNWGIAQMQNMPSPKGQNGFANFNIEQDVQDKIVAFFQDELKPLAESSQKVLEKNANDLMKYIEDPSRTLFEIFEYVSMKVVDFGIDLAGKIIIGFLKVVEEALKAFETAMKSELNIPVIKTLFKLVCGYDVPFNVINAAALVLALPTTIFCKLAGIKLPKDNDVNKLPEWSFHVVTWGGLAMQGIQYLVTGVGMIANWLTSADPSHEGGKGAATIVSFLNSVIIVPLRLFLGNPYFDFTPPKTDIELAETIMDQIHWWTNVVDSIWGFLSSMVSLYIPEIAMMVIDILYTSVAFWLYLIEDLILMIIKIVRNSIEIDVWNIIKSVLDMIQKTVDNFSKSAISVGNILPAVDPATIIIKAIPHGIAVAGMLFCLTDQTIISVVDTVHYYSE